MRGIGIATLSMLGLAACAPLNPGPGWGGLSYDALRAETRRDIDEAYRDLPFDSGAVSVLVTERSALKTYQLLPCGGNHICAKSASGQRGHMQRTEDYFVVTGAYAGRVFYLSPGGDGYVMLGTARTALAWN